MASAEFDLEEDFSCAVCLSLLEDPKMLPCSHVFCRKCLQPPVGSNKTVKCPECRMVHPVPGGDAGNLTTDLRCKNLIEKYLASRGRLGLIGRTWSRAAQIQALNQLEENWENFRKENAEQRKKSDRRITNRINSLQQKKSEVLKVYDDYDKYALDRITNIQQMKQIKESVQELRDKMDSLMSEIIPDTLGLVSTVLLERDIKHFAGPITRRQAGKDADVKLVYSEIGDVREYEGMSPFLTSKVLAAGNIEIYRHRGGLHELHVVDKNESKILKKFYWNNRAQSAITPTMASRVWYHVPWSLTTGGRAVLYSTRIADTDRSHAFYYAMFHAHLMDVA